MHFVFSPRVLTVQFDFKTEVRFFGFFCKNYVNGPYALPMVTTFVVVNIFDKHGPRDF